MMENFIEKIKNLTEQLVIVTAERDAEKGRADKAEAERDALIKDFTNYAMCGTTDPSPYCANKAECIADDGWCILERCNFYPKACGQRKAEDDTYDSQFEKAEESKLFKRGDAIIYHGSNGQKNCECFFGNYNEDGTCNIYNGWDLTHVPLTCIARKIDDSLQT